MAPKELNARVERWVSAGLLSAEQAGVILQFEAEREKAARIGRPARAVALLGALTLVSGLGSVIAYNWDGISNLVKLLGMGVVLLVSVAYAFRVHPRGGTSFEVAALVTSGLSLGSLALVSQIYAQDGSLWQLLAFWCAISLPLLLLTTSRFLTMYTFAALLVALLSAVEDLNKLLRDNGFSDGSEVGAALTIFFVSALISLGFQRSLKPERHAVGTWLFGVHLVGLGAIGGLAFLADDTVSPMLLAIGFVGALAALALLRGEGASALGLGPWPVVSGLFVLGLLQVLVPLGVVRSESRVAAFLAFVLFFGLYFWAAEKAHSDRGVRLAVGFLGLRTVIASFELFENLLITGLVLMGLGALALFLTRRRLGGATRS